MPFGELLTDLETAGFLVFGGREGQVMEGGVEARPHPFPVLILRVLRSTNPEIQTIDLRKDKVQSQQRKP